jgi:hypothetical protein
MIYIRLGELAALQENYEFLDAKSFTCSTTAIRRILSSKPLRFKQTCKS